MEVELLYAGQKFVVYYIKNIKANVVAVYSEDMDEANKKQFLQLVHQVGDVFPLTNVQKCRKVESQERLFELKPGSWRVPFFYHPYQQGQIVLTHAFPKEGAKAQTNEFEYAAKVRDELLAALAAVEEEKDNAKAGDQKFAKQTPDKSGRKGKS